MFTPWNQETSLIRTTSYIPRICELERFQCVLFIELLLLSTAHFISLSMLSAHSLSYFSCLGYKPDQYKLGDCNRFNPCSKHSCGEGSRCMPNHRVCLEGNSNECTQHTCGKRWWTISVFFLPSSYIQYLLPSSESLLQMCNGSPSPVCDASNSQHSTLCNFLRTDKEFGYHGYCRVCIVCTVTVSNCLILG